MDTTQQRSTTFLVQASLGRAGQVRPENWERYGLKSWIEAAQERLHHNVLAIALPNKLARIAWAVLQQRARAMRSGTEGGVSMEPREATCS
jgi:hypothetical protein